MDNDEAEQSDASNQERNGPQDQMVKKLVRLALACEYNRRPIKRADISEKVLGSASGAKTFKTVFQAAQHELRMVFGMEMVELPGREKVTLQQKRGSICISALLEHELTSKSGTKVPNAIEQDHHFLGSHIDPSTTIQSGNRCPPATSSADECR